MKYFLISFNHKNSNVTIREKFAFSQEKTKLFLETILDENIIEAIYISTCNRVEVIAYVEDEKLAKDSIFDTFTRLGITDVDFEQGDILVQENAIKHIFKVMSSLDSIVVGETQISGQIKKAFTFSIENKYCSKHLLRAMHKAFKVSANVRNETHISEKPISVASVAVEKAKEIMGGNLGGFTALVVGTGEISRLVAKHLARNKVNVIVFNRTLQHAKDLASELGSTAEYKEFEYLSDYINKYRLVFSATSSSDFIISKNMIHEVEFKRHWFDLAIPRDIDTEINETNIEVIVVDDLKDIASKNKKTREKEALVATSIIDSQTDDFFKYIQTLSIEPLIKDIRQHAKSCAATELARAIKKGFIPQRFEKDVERFLHSVFNSFLHNCTTNLKEITNTPEADTIVSSMRKVMGFNEENEIPQNMDKCPYNNPMN